MDDQREITPSSNRTDVERRSDREVVVTRTFDAPPHVVFAAWTVPALFMRWWAPKSAGVPMLSCELDVRTGGTYRIAFGHDAEHSRAFFGRYLEVIPDARLVWTNDEEGGGAVTTVTFEGAGGRTRLALHELHPSKEALDDACVGMEGGVREQFDQLDALLAASIR